MPSVQNGAFLMKRKFPLASQPSVPTVLLLGQDQVRETQLAAVPVGLRVHLLHRDLAPTPHQATRREKVGWQKGLATMYFLPFPIKHHCKVQADHHMYILRLQIPIIFSAVSVG